MNSVKKRISLCPNNFVKITHYACFFECSDKGRENWNALRPRGPFLFRSAGKGSKRGRSDRRDGRLCTAHRQQEALMHVRTRSANLPKLNASRRFKHMERFVFAPAVRGRGKNPLTSHVERFCGRCREAEAAPSGPRPVYSGSGFELSSSVQWNISLKSLKHSGQIQ